MSAISGHPHEDLSIDRHLALRTAASRPAERLAGRRPGALARMEGHHADGGPVVLFQIAEVRPIRDEIERRVRRLLDELDVIVGSGR